MYLPKDDKEKHVQLQKEIRENDKIKEGFRKLRQINLKKATNGEGIYGI